MSGPILNIERVWWRNVPKGEFFNVERHPSTTQGGQGALYFEIPKSLVAATLDFLELTSVGSLPFTIRLEFSMEPEIQGHLSSGPNQAAAC